MPDAGELMTSYASPLKDWAILYGDRMAYPRKALFLDRDGTLIENVPYLNDPEKVKLFGGVADVIRAFRDCGYAIVVVTNQSGIARGRCTMAQYRAVEAKLRQLLGGDAVDAVFACPFLPGVQGIYGQEHSWRKPGDGMLLAAALMLHLDLSESVIVGDSLSDLLAGARAGNRWLVHVLTGHGAQEREAVVEHFEQASSPESMGHKLLLLDNISQLNPTLLKIP